MAKLLLVGVYQLPAPLGVSEGCFGKTLKITIGGLAGKATLGSLDWSGDRPRVTSPSMPLDVKERVDQHIDDTQDGWDHWGYWGSVSSWNPTRKSIISAAVGALLVEFQIAPE